jgi:hypothetical protein
LIIEEKSMTAESDGTKKPDGREKTAKSEEQGQSKTDAKDNSKLQSQSSTNPKPFMIYPIPKAGAPEEADQAPQGMTYDQVLAKNAPVNTRDQKAGPVESTASTSINPADGAEKSSNTSNDTHTERVSRTLIDFVVPQADKLDGSPLQTSPANTSSETVSNTPPNAVAKVDVDHESSAAALSRIASSQAINHEKDSNAVRPPEVPPPMRRKRSAPKTMLDILVRVGNQLTGAGHAPEIAPERPVQGMDNSSEQQAQLPVQLNAEHAESPSTEYYSNEAHYPAPDYSGSNEPHTFYQGADGQLAGPEETRGERISRTLLDHSVLFDTVSKSAEKMILKAAEEQKEKRSEPFVPFIPVMEDRISSPCPWKWEGNEGKDRVKYCDKCKQQQVYNFTGIERPEADALIFKRESRAAKTLFKREDGKFMTSDCPIAVKQTRGMVLAVVMGLFFLVVMFASMLLTPQQPKQAVVKQEESPSNQGTYYSPVRRGRGSSVSHAGTAPTGAGAPTQTTSSSNGRSAVSLPASTSSATPSATSLQTTGSNGGYGPITAPTPAANDFQWKYTSDPEKNPTPVTSPNVTPAPPQVDPAQAAELQRLKQQIIDSGSK